MKKLRQLSSYVMYQLAQGHTHGYGAAELPVPGPGKKKSQERCRPEPSRCCLEDLPLLSGALGLALMLRVPTTAHPALFPPSSQCSPPSIMPLPLSLPPSSLMNLFPSGRRTRLRVGVQLTPFCLGKPPNLSPIQPSLITHPGSHPKSQEGS